ncbi:spore coat associated protein CotJA [Fodinisporobacter ferrooxydans]|uniref:Spore coat associated protein CotJA n=1 Tax=Fodinisporobacter ferrooxydans TaxID=2901836 RepID=A0ABY4CFG6_9BACL|nr:spore coat associated protein CotJA [Alicyclobacillaceae bacterium MYW30-H2]
MHKQFQFYEPYVSPYDPCKPSMKSYVVPPNQYVGFQPYHSQQFAPMEAFRHGTLWPLFFSPYEGEPQVRGEQGGKQE